MAFLTFGGVAVNMADGDLVSFAGSDDPTFAPSLWTWATPDGHNVVAQGSGLSFDADGRAVSGRISEIGLHLEGNGANDDTPEVRITQVGANAAVLDDDPTAFWNAVLAGTSFINAQALTAETTGGARSVIFGDDLQDEVGSGADDGSVTDRGGNDVITLGTASLVAIGDVAGALAGGVAGGAPSAATRAATTSCSPGQPARSIR